MASFPYNSSSLLFQQLRNISSYAVEDANNPQHCSQAGHKETMDRKGLCSSR